MLIVIFPILTFQIILLTYYFNSLWERTLSRLARSVATEVDMIIDQVQKGHLTENEIKNTGQALISNLENKIKGMKINEALEDIMQFIRGVNKYMEEQAPWKLVKEDKESAARVLYTAGEALRIGAVLLSPVIPNRSAILIEALNATEAALEWGGLTPGNQLRDHQPLFPRI